MLRLFLNLGFVTTMERLRKVILGGGMRCNNDGDAKEDYSWFITITESI